jgi:hypothetical protein
MLTILQAIDDVGDTWIVREVHKMHDYSQLIPLALFLTIMVGFLLAAYAAVHVIAQDFNAECARRSQQHRRGKEAQ